MPTANGHLRRRNLAKKHQLRNKKKGCRRVSFLCSMDTALSSITAAQRTYFQSGATRSYAFRQAQLLALRKALLQHEEAINAALYTDLKKSPEEVWITELGFVLHEITGALKNLRRWMQRERVRTNFINLPGSSFILKEPLGVVLIIGPWNYPLQLVLAPLIGAIAAGNCAVVKPSELAPATAAVIQTLVHSAFRPEYITAVQGEGSVIVPELMKGFRFDHLFFTGSIPVGKIIYSLAAEKLVPVTLELGGKSPCVVEGDAALKVAARRIAMTKFSNAGQMCVAPDYLLLHRSIKETFLAELIHTIEQFYSSEPHKSYHYGKIINEKQWNRLRAYLQQGRIVYGGGMDSNTHHLQPTLLEEVPLDSPLMNEEIFGPLLPIYTFDTAEEAKAIIARHPDPLAFYVFTESRQKEQQWLQEVAFGGGCVNNAAWHLTNPALPFGGRGFSGTGAYHGEASFRVFSHRKSVLKTPTWFDPAFKYPPLEGKLKWFKKLIR